jgi:X-X-X-Leu-X-X-Gly heptad repeat protein
MSMSKPLAIILAFAIVAGPPLAPPLAAAEAAEAAEAPYAPDALAAAGAPYAPDALAAADAPDVPAAAEASDVSAAADAPAAERDASPAAPATERDARPTDADSRDEVVYASLDGNGNVGGVYVVTTLRSASAHKIEEHGAFSSVRNLTDTSAMAVSGETVTIDSGSKQFVYQGNTVSTVLPWKIQMEWKLDGRVVEPRQLAGASGKLEFTLRTTPQGSYESFSDNYMLQATVSLGTDTADNVASKDAAIVLAGSKRQLNFTVMPGKAYTGTFTADVSDFELDPIEIAAIPFSMAFDMPDSSELVGGLDDLTDAVALLDDGATKLRDGGAQLAAGSGQISSGSATLRDGLNALGANARLINEASSQINAALGMIAQGLGGGTDLDIAALGQLPAALAQMADGLDAANAGIQALAPGYAQAFAGLDAMMAALPQAGTQLDADVMALAMANPTDATIQALVQYYFAAQAVSGQYATLRPAFQAAGDALTLLPDSLSQTSAALRAIASQLPDAATAQAYAEQLAALSSALVALDANYASFHAGLAAYNDGVIMAGSSYGSMHDGILAWADGTRSLSSGISAYSEGVSSLRIETSSLPEKVQESLDEFMADYKPSDFQAASFVSADNINTNSVSFVLRTAAISLPSVSEIPTEASAEPTILDRLLALFGL